LDRPMYLLGYLTNQSRVYLIDKQFNVVGYTLLLSLIEYKTLVMRGDFDRANDVLSSIPKEQYDSVARFLESRGMLEEALEIATDTNYRFDLAVQLGRLEIAKAIATEVQSVSKCKQIGELAMSTGKLDMAEECLLHAMDLSGLLLLYSSLGDADGITKLASVAKEQGKNNVSFLCFFMLGKLEECLQLLIESNRIPEAALMARSYLPSKVPEIIALWKKDLQKVNPKAAESLADPNEYPNLFDDWQIALNVEATVAPKRGIYPPAEEYMNHAERSSESLVEAFKNMHVHEEALPDDIEDAVDEVVEDGGVEESQEDAVEVDAEDAEVEESQDDAVEVEAEGSTDGAVLVNGNSSEEQWGTKNEEPSA
jgi:coatomer subunit beta'